MTKLSCPKCLGTNISTVGTTHYICNNPECENNGAKTQFHINVDDKVRFPYNQIFVNRSRQEFFRKPYITLASRGSMDT